VSKERRLGAAPLQIAQPLSRWSNSAAYVCFSAEVSAYQRNFFAALIGDGRPMLMLVGLSLCLSGGFALFLSATGRFLPHDIDFLGMTAQALCGVDQCRIVHFMFHDRVAFGGSLIAIGLLYMWMAEFPLGQGEAWAWWLFVVSGVTGFGSFLAYLGYGYLDTWHGTATLILLPCYLCGLYRTWGTLAKPRGISTLLPTTLLVPWNIRLGLGKLCLMAVAAGMICGGLTIMGVGMTRVFVPQDLDFLSLKPADLFAVNPRLVPLIAHDRAGFGGGVCSCGILVLFLVWRGTPCRSLWQVLLLAGSVGFGTALGVHFAIGYLDAAHLAPALLGLLVFIIGILLLKKPMCQPGAIPSNACDESIRSAPKTA
jgi:hypothetical protein